MRYEKLVCVGLYKTGTSTFAECCRILGLNLCPESVGYKHTLPLNDALKIYQAFEDYPWFVADTYQTIRERFPNTGFLLTSRDPERWYESFRRWLGVNVHLPNTGLETVFGDCLKPLDRERAIECFNTHNRDVEHYFSGQDNFLKVDWEAGDGWNELCNWLSVPTPPCKFPHMLRYDTETNTYTNS